MRIIYRFPGLTVPPVDALLTAKALTRLAVAAEQAGFGAVALDEHPIPDDHWRRHGQGHDSLDPFIGLAGVAAATSTIRLFVYAAIVPVHNPFLLAKAAATLDLLSEGRLDLGLAGGYLPGEIEALGVDFASRNERFDEHVDSMRTAWTGEPVNIEGSGYRAVDVVARPTPVQPGGPRLWIAGNTQRALDRVARYGHWMALPNPRAGQAVSRRTAPLDGDDDLRAYRERVVELAAARGRTDPIQISIPYRPDPDPARSRERLAELEELGVGWVMITGGGATVDEALAHVDALAELVE